MYAVIKTGGKQYRVSQGDMLEVEKLSAEVGDRFDFDQVLLLSENNEVTVGHPIIEGAKVTATIEAQDRGKKIIVYKHKKNYHKKQGHRQDFTRVKIDEILRAGEEPAIREVATPQPEENHPPVVEETPQVSQVDDVNEVVDTEPGNVSLDETKEDEYGA
jgi:large subunit ribosomal protein L21